MKKPIAAASIRVLAFVPVPQDVPTPSGAHATADADEDRAAETRTVPFADTADSVAADDFDGDGHADVVVASRGRDELTFLAGKGERVRLCGARPAAGRSDCAGVRGNQLRGRFAGSVVGIIADDGPEFLVLEDRMGTVKSEPEVTPFHIL